MNFQLQFIAFMANKQQFINGNRACFTRNFNALTRIFVQFCPGISVLNTSMGSVRYRHGKYPVPPPVALCQRLPDVLQRFVHRRQTYRYAVQDAQSPDSVCRSPADTGKTSSLPEANWQHASCQRVQRTGMPGTVGVINPFHFCSASLLDIPCGLSSNKTPLMSRPRRRGRLISPPCCRPG